MRYWYVIEIKIKNQKDNLQEKIHHTGIHVVGQYFLEDTPRCFQIKEDEMHAKKLTYDAMYI